MKTIYNVRNRETGELLGEYASKQEAGEAALRYINKNGLSPFDFAVEEVNLDVNDLITSFEEAEEYIGIDPADRILVCQSDQWNILAEEINPSNVAALVALNRLFTIAEAWNKADGFDPSFDGKDKHRSFPWFTFSRAGKTLFCSQAQYAPSNINSLLATRLGFATAERARQFGRMFADLFNMANVIKVCEDIY